MMVILSASWLNAFVNLVEIDFEFFVLGKMLKLGVELDVVTFFTLIIGFCNRSKIFETMILFDKMIEKGYQPNLFVYTTILNGGV